MRLEQALAAISVLLVLPRVGVSQDEPRSQTSFAVSLTAERTLFKLGVPVPLRLISTNTTDHDLRFDVMVLQCKPLNYVPVTVRQMRVDMYDSEGNPVPLTLYGRVVQGRVGAAGERGGAVEEQAGACAGKGQPVILKPGESRIEEVDVSKEFDIKRPGTYTVRARGFGEDRMSGVKSDAVTVTFRVAQ